MPPQMPPWPPATPGAVYAVAVYASFTFSIAERRRILQASDSMAASLGFDAESFAAALASFSGVSADAVTLDVGEVYSTPSGLSSFQVESKLSGVQQPDSVASSLADMTLSDMQDLLDPAMQAAIQIVSVGVKTETAMIFSPSPSSPDDPAPTPPHGPNLGAVDEDDSSALSDIMRAPSVKEEGVLLASFALTFTLPLVLVFWLYRRRLDLDLDVQDAAKAWSPTTLKAHLERKPQLPAGTMITESSRRPRTRLELRRRRVPLRRFGSGDPFDRGALALKGSWFNVTAEAMKLGTNSSDSSEDPVGTPDSAGCDDLFTSDLVAVRLGVPSDGGTSPGPPPPTTLPPTAFSTGVPTEVVDTASLWARISDRDPCEEILGTDYYHDEKESFEAQPPMELSASRSEAVLARARARARQRISTGGPSAVPSQQQWLAAALSAVKAEEELDWPLMTVVDSRATSAVSQPPADAAVSVDTAASATEAAATSELEGGGNDNGSQCYWPRAPMRDSYRESYGRPSKSNAYWENDSEAVASQSEVKPPQGEIATQVDEGMAELSGALMEASASRSDAVLSRARARVRVAAHTAGVASARSTVPSQQAWLAAAMGAVTAEEERANGPVNVQLDWLQMSLAEMHSEPSSPEPSPKHSASPRFLFSGLAFNTPTPPRVPRSAARPSPRGSFFSDSAPAQLEAHLTRLSRRSSMSDEEEMDV